MMRLRSLALLTAGVFLAGMYSSYAHAGPCDVIIHIKSVLATDIDEPVDPQLKELQRKLQLLFNFKAYHLESHRDAETQCGKMVEFTLQAGHILHVQPREIDGDMIDMEVVLFDGAKPMLTTDFKLHNGGTLLLGGPRYQQGMLIITVGATAGPEPSPHPSASPAGDESH
jgi:hypothetical protein